MTRSTFKELVKAPIYVWSPSDVVESLRACVSGDV